MGGEARSQASPERHSVGIGKIWYGIWVIGAPQRPGVPLDTPPPHIPSDPIDDPTLPPGARGPLFIFRKIHLYGKTKKSTHGHTNEKPICTEKSFASSEIFHSPRPPTHAQRRDAPRQPAPPLRPPAAAKTQCTAQRSLARLRKAPAATR